MDAELDVIVIGSGIGGLAASASLAKEGFKVGVFEKLHGSGGFLGTFKRGDYWFEASTHQIGAAFLNEQFLKPELDRLELNIPFISLDHAFEAIVFGDRGIHSRYPVRSGLEKFCLSLAQCCPGAQEDLAKLLAHIENISTDSIRLRRDRKAQKQVDFDSYPYFKAFKDQSFEELLNVVGHDALKFLISQYCFYYVCCYPSKIPAVFMSNLIANLMFKKPLFIQGGSRVLIDACLKTIKKYGGDIRYHAEVNEILLEGNKAVGIRLENGDRYFAEYIVSNVNAYTTYAKWIKTKAFDDDRLVKKLADYRPSKSVFQVYLGLPFTLEEYGYSYSTMFFSGSDNINQLYKDCSNEEVNSFLITNYTTMDPSFSETGKSSVVLTEYRDDFSYWAGLSGEKYRLEKENAKNKFIAKVRRITGIPFERAEVSLAATPRTMEFYSGNINGAVFGGEICSFANDKPVENLFLAGADATYAGSVVSSFDSGINIAETIRRSKKIQVEG